MNCSWEFARDLFEYSSSSFFPFRNKSPDEDLTAIVLNMRPYIPSDVADLLRFQQSIYFGIECKDSASIKIQTLLKEKLLGQRLTDKENFENDAPGVGILCLKPETEPMALEGVKRFVIWIRNDEFMHGNLSKILNVISSKIIMGKSALPQSIVNEVIQKAKGSEEI